MRRMRCGPVVEVIAVITAIFGTAIAIRGWPESAGFGTWGEWAGALLSGAASLTAIGIAWWSHDRQNAGARQAAAFEILGSKNLILSTLERAYELDTKLETYTTQREMAINQVRHAMMRQAEAQKPKAIETRIEVDREKLRETREGLRQAQELNQAVNAYIQASGTDAESIKGQLSGIRHESAAMFDPAFARAIVVAKGQFTLVEMHTRRPYAVVQARDALQVGIEQLRIAHKRTDAAEDFVASLGQAD